MSFEHDFACPLPNGLHARPASQLAEVALKFGGEITLTNLRSGAVANAKSVLALVAADIRNGDPCRLRASGAGAAEALASLRGFVEDVLPGCDEGLPCGPAAAELRLPRRLREAGVRWHAGTIVCTGVGQGSVLFHGIRSLPADLEGERPLPAKEEAKRLKAAVSALRAYFAERLDARPPEVEAGILRAHLAIVQDVGLTEDILARIASGRSAAAAIVQAAASFAEKLKATGSAYVRERAVDVEDIGHALLERVLGRKIGPETPELTKPSIVAADNLTPRQVLSLDRSHLRALVLERAGTTSHAMILARSFGIPTLTGVEDVRANLTAGHVAIVDANLGIVLPEVSEPVRIHYERERKRLARREQRSHGSAAGLSSTRDGRRLEVGANVATAEEILPAIARGADGIGLFRTEMLYIDREEPPNEEEQLAIYARAARDAGGRTVLVRTFDIGGDKPVPYLELPRETNPFLGYRGVRIYPEHRELLRVQLRAILRASAFGRLGLLLPMISTTEEVRWVRGEIASIRAELDGAGVRYDAGLRVGIMVEVPSTAFLLDRLASEIDFLSVGTNDLLQYFLAVDRGSDRVAGLYRSRHPSFLRFLAKIADDARRNGLWVGMCGEMAGDRSNLPLLLGLGLDEISVAAPEIQALKAEIARQVQSECRSLLEAAMDCADVAGVEELLARHRRRGAAESLLDPELVVMDSTAATKGEVIEELVDALFCTGRTDRPIALEDAVWAREEVYSTGLGHGFAIPHCKSDAIGANSIAVARLRRPLPWQSVDDRPVSCAILLAVRESDEDGSHMKVFSKLARRLMHEEFRERMLAARDKDAVLSCLAEELGLESQEP